MSATQQQNPVQVIISTTGMGQFLVERINSEWIPKARRKFHDRHSSAVIADAAKFVNEYKAIWIRTNCPQADDTWEFTTNVGIFTFRQVGEAAVVYAEANYRQAIGDNLKAQSPSMLAMVWDESVDLFMGFITSLWFKMLALLGSYAVDYVLGIILMWGILSGITSAAMILVAVLIILLVNFLFSVAEYPHAYYADKVQLIKENKHPDCSIWTPYEKERALKTARQNAFFWRIVMIANVPLDAMGFATLLTGPNSSQSDILIAVAMGLFLAIALTMFQYGLKSDVDSVLARTRARRQPFKQQ